MLVVFVGLAHDRVSGGPIVNVDVQQLAGQDDATGDGLSGPVLQGVRDELADEDLSGFDEVVSAAAPKDSCSEVAQVSHPAAFVFRDGVGLVPGSALKAEGHFVEYDPCVIREVSLKAAIFIVHCCRGVVVGGPVHERCHLPGGASAPGLAIGREPAERARFGCLRGRRVNDIRWGVRHGVA